MKCPRCEKEFQFEFLSVQHWLKSCKLDKQQISFLLYNFGGPLCRECEDDLVSGFYLLGIKVLKLFFAIVIPLFFWIAPSSSYFYPAKCTRGRDGFYPTEIYGQDRSYYGECRSSFRLYSIDYLWH